MDLRETVKLSNIAIKSVLKRQSNKSSSGGFSDLPQRSIGFFFPAKSGAYICPVRMNFADKCANEKNELTAASLAEN